MACGMKHGYQQVLWEVVLALAKKTDQVQRSFGRRSNLYYSHIKARVRDAMAFLKTEDCQLFASVTLGFMSTKLLNREEIQ